MQSIYQYVFNSIYAQNEEAVGLIYLLINLKKYNIYKSVGNKDIKWLESKHIDASAPVKHMFQISQLQINKYIYRYTKVIVF